jgi:hypothetical protein
VPTTATIRKPMQCSLSQDELLARLEDHRATVNALRDLDEERKVVMRQLAERKKRLQAEEIRLDSVCNQKWENRDVECLVDFHKPVVGQKTTIRTDTGEIVGVEDMTEDEKQERLFEEKAEFEKVVGDIPPVSPYDTGAEGEPDPEVRITESPVKEVQDQDSHIDSTTGLASGPIAGVNVPEPVSAEVVGSCIHCGKDVPKFALDEGKCAFCEKPLDKCETCGGYLFDERVIHSLSKCEPRPVETEGEDSALDPGQGPEESESADA